jgi:hypothetical protein
VPDRLNPTRTGGGSRGGSTEPDDAEESREDALLLYAATVNRDNTLFSNNETLPEKLKLMRSLLHDPITVCEADTLNDVLFRRQRFTDMIAWLQDDPVSWNAYFAREKVRAEEADRQLAS